MNDVDRTMEEFDSFEKDFSSSKSTTRRRGMKNTITKITQLIEDNSFTKVANKYKWKSFFKSMIEAFYDELQHQRSRKRPMKEFFINFRDFVCMHLENCTIAILECSSINNIVKLIIQILDDPFTLEEDMSSQFCEIIKKIMVHNTYRNYMRPNKFTNTVNKLFAILKKKKKLVLKKFAWCLHTLFSKYPLLSRIGYFEVATFFRRFKEILRNEPKSSLFSPVVASLNVLIRRVGINYIDTVRKMSSSIRLIGFWRKCQNDEMKKEILNFYIGYCKLKFDENEIPFNSLSHLSKTYECLKHSLDNNDMFRNTTPELLHKFYTLASEIVVFMEIKRRSTQLISNEPQKKKRKVMNIKEEIRTHISLGKFYKNWLILLLYISRKIKNANLFPFSHLTQTLFEKYNETENMEVKIVILNTFEEILKNNLHKNVDILEGIKPLVKDIFTKDIKILMNPICDVISTSLLQVDSGMNYEVIFKSKVFCSIVECSNEKLKLVNQVLYKSGSGLFDKEPFIKMVFYSVFKNANFALLGVLAINLLMDCNYKPYIEPIQSKLEEDIKCESVYNIFHELNDQNEVKSTQMDFDCDIKLDDVSIKCFMDCIMVISKKLCKQEKSSFFGNYNPKSLFCFANFFLDVLPVLLNINGREKMKKNLIGCFKNIFHNISLFVKKEYVDSKVWDDFLLDALFDIMGKIDGTSIDCLVVGSKLQMYFQKTVEKREISRESQSQSSENEWMDDDENTSVVDEKETKSILIKLCKVLPIICVKCQSVHEKIQTSLINSLNSFSDDIFAAFIICNSLCDVANEASLKAVLKFLRKITKKEHCGMWKYGDDEIRVLFLNILRRIFKYSQETFHNEVFKSCEDLLISFSKYVKSKMKPNSKTKISFIKCTVEYFRIDKSKILTENQENGEQEESKRKLIDYFFCDLPNDDDHFVRIHSAHNHHYAVCEFTDLEEGAMFDSVFRSGKVLKFSVENDDDIRTRSSIACLCFFTIFCKKFELDGIFRLMDLVKRDYDEEDLVELGMKLIAKKKGYKNTRELLDEFFPFLMYRWLRLGCESTDYTVKTFPHIMFMYEKSERCKFLEDYAPEILSMAFVDFESKAKDICIQMGKSITDVEDSSNPFCFAEITAMKILRAMKDGKVVVLKSSNLNKYMEYIIFELFNRCDPFTKDPIGPYFSKNVIVNSLKCLTKLMKYSSVLDLFTSKSFLLLHVIINLQIKAEKSVTFRSRYITLFIWLIEVLKKKIHGEAIMRNVLHFCYRMFFYPNELSLALQLMNKVFDELVIEKEKSEIEFGKCVKKITIKLFKMGKLLILHKERNVDHLKGIENLLKKIFTTSYMYLGPIFPSEEENEIAQKLFKFKFKEPLNNISLSNLIKSFLTPQGNAKLPLILRKLMGNVNEVDTLRKDIFTSFCEKLLRICGEHKSDEKMKSEARKCICQMGMKVLGSFKEDFGTRKELEYSTFESHVKLQNSKNAELKLSIHQLCFHLITLNEYLTDDSPDVIEMAFGILINIFRKYSKKLLRYEQFKTPSFQIFSAESRNNILLYDKFERKRRSTRPQIFLTKDTWMIKNHNEWVMKISYCLSRLDDVGITFKITSPMCLEKVEFAESMFNAVLFSIYLYDIDYIKQVSHFLHKILEREDTDLRSIRLIISSLLTIHKKIRHKLKNVGLNDNENEFDYGYSIPYIVTIRAAIRCKAYVAGLYFIEMYREENRVLQSIPTDLKFEEEIEEWQRLLIEIYKNLNEPDGIYGVNYYCGTNSKLVRYEHEYNWSSALGTYDNILYNSKDPYSLDAFGGFLSSLQNVDDNFLLSTFIKSIPKERMEQSKELQEKYFETAWRLGANMKFYTGRSFGGFNETLYKSLSFLKTGNSEQFLSLMKSARDKIKFDSNTMISSEIVKLQMLSDIEEAFEIKWNKIDEDGDVEMDIKKKNPFKIQKGSKFLDQNFEDVEKLLILRKNLLQILGNTEDMKEHICTMAEFCRKEGRNDLARNIIHEVSQFYGRDEVPKYLFVEAKICWKEEKNDIPIDMLKFLLKHFRKIKTDIPSNKKIIGDVYLSLGKWEGHSKSSDHSVINKYFKKAIKNRENETHSRAIALYRYAKYLDAVYISLMKHMNSREYKRNLEIYTRDREEYDKINKHYQSHKRKKNRNETQFAQVTERRRVLLKNIKRDKAFIDQINKRYKKFCKGALDNYIESLICGGLESSSKYDISTVFRFCSIWFAQSNFNDKEILKIIEKKILRNKNFPYFKFIVLVYQIASRLGKSDQLEKLLTKIASQHPYHSLYQIIALRNGDKVTNVGKKARIDHDPNKIKAAERVLISLQAKNKNYNILIKQMDVLVDAYMELANFHIDHRSVKNNQVFKMKKFNLNKLPKLKNLSKVIATTLIIPVRTSRDYSDYVESSHVRDFEEEFITCGGVNVPKIVKCYTSSGEKVKQLVKGNDDSRQDAVMQQIFKLVNVCLRNNKQTRKRNLNIKTYSIIPLSPRTGVLGWCIGTIPLHNYLTGKNTPEKRGAHDIYRPRDRSNAVCRDMINKAMDEPDDERFSVYKDVCENMKPVFHHFFLENGEDPSTWFAKQLNYTRSVATNSMVGYILGIGDRHPSNILIMVETAEVVHIDLGVAFEQGKLLKYPELIPFRLTRDVVDGFGVQGVNGTFRRCSIETLKVLRASAELLETVLEVFIHDPLYKWSLSAEHLLNLQKDTSNESFSRENNNRNLDISNNNTSTTPNRDAEGCLIQLRAKLKGVQDNEFMSVSGQVNRLINEARDESKLSLLFSGWSAHL